LCTSSRTVLRTPRTVCLHATDHSWDAEEEFYLDKNYYGCTKARALAALSPGTAVNNAENYGVSASMLADNAASAERTVAVFRSGRVLSDPVLNEGPIPRLRAKLSVRLHDVSCKGCVSMCIPGLFSHRFERTCVLGSRVITKSQVAESETKAAARCVAVVYLDSVQVDCYNLEGIIYSDQQLERYVAILVNVPYSCENE
jgi:hypothetical protein